MSDATATQKKRKKSREEIIDSGITPPDVATTGVLLANKSSKRKRARDETEDTPTSSHEVEHRKKKKKKKEKAYLEVAEPAGNGAADGVEDVAQPLAKKHKKRTERNETKEERRERRAKKKLRKLERQQRDTEAQATQREPHLGEPRSTLKPGSHDEAHASQLLTAAGHNLQDPDDIMLAIQSVTFKSTAPRVTGPTSSTAAPSKARKKPHSTPIEPATGQSARKASRPSHASTKTAPKGNLEHEELLSKRFLPTEELNRLAEEMGLEFKKGKFSAIETELVQGAIRKYQLDRDLSDEAIIEIIFTKDKKLKAEHNQPFWTAIASAVPQRPKRSVWNFVRRAYSPVGKQGQWSREEDQALKQAVANLGEKWEKVGESVGRTGSDCRDRYRNYVKNRSQQNTGRWSREEEDDLTKIVMSAIDGRQGVDDTDIFWTVISEKMGHKRNRQQCRIKWQDDLCARIKNNGLRATWENNDTSIFIRKIASLDVNDETEIQWETLRDKAWNLFSAHQLGKKWLHLKRSIKGDELPFQEVVKRLRAKYSASTSKFKSSETIADEYLAEE